MDCDFSHSPGDLNRLQALLGTYPVVIEAEERQARCRGLAIASTPYLKRRVFMPDGFFPLQYATLPPLQRLSPRTLEAQLEHLNLDGFGFQIEVTAHLLALGFTIHEMPIQFSDRTVGQSKMTAQIFVEAMWKVWKIRASVRDL